MFVYGVTDEIVQNYCKYLLLITKQFLSIVIDNRPLDQLNFVNGCFMYTHIHILTYIQLSNI